MAPIASAGVTNAAIAMRRCNGFMAPPIAASPLACELIDERVLPLVVGRAQEWRHPVAIVLGVLREIVRCPILEAAEMIPRALRLPDDPISKHPGLLGEAFGERLHQFYELRDAHWRDI